MESPKGFKFVAGHTEGKSKTKRSYSDYKKEVSLLHNQLQTALYEELSQRYGSDFVATEQSCGSGNRIDLVVKKDSLYSLYEIKTLSTAKSCIREALGQLMEYAFYNDDIPIDKLVIVSPYELKNSDVEYLARIKEKFSLPIEYMAYSL